MNLCPRGVLLEFEAQLARLCAPDLEQPIAPDIALGPPRPQRSRVLVIAAVMPWIVQSLQDTFLIHVCKNKTPLTICTATSGTGRTSQGARPLIDSMPFGDR